MYIFKTSLIFIYLYLYVRLPLISLPKPSAKPLLAALWTAPNCQALPSSSLQAFLAVKSERLWSNPDTISRAQPGPPGPPQHS